MVLLHPRLTTAERTRLLARVAVDLTIDEHWADNELPAATGEWPAGAPDSAPLAILFTSGTSGEPKAVVLSRKAFAVAAAASAENLGWREDDRWLLTMPLAHVGGLSIPLRCLAARRPIVIQPWTSGVESVIATLERERVTLTSFVPAMLMSVLEKAADLPSSLRAILLGGDRAPPSLLDAARTRNVPVLTSYGMTETCAQVVTQSPGEAPDVAAGVGHPLPGVEIAIVDGEIHVRSGTLLSGYLEGDALISPLTGEGWLPTGDRGEIDASGRLFVLGRKKELIITGGENVDPREVEDAILEHPAIANAAVFGVEDDRWGEIVAAAIVPRGEGPNLTELTEFFTTVLAAHKRPRRIAFCDVIPLTASSKTDRRSVAAAVVDRLVPLSYHPPQKKEPPDGSRCL
jgi:O-succinylbenzoic acid--CoA ligase